jgi:hypothetical protein
MLLIDCTYQFVHRLFIAQLQVRDAVGCWVSILPPQLPPFRGAVCRCRCEYSVYSEYSVQCVLYLRVPMHTPRSPLDSTDCLLL